MKKTSGFVFTLLNFIFWLALILVNIFYLKPVVKSNYLDSDILGFKNNSWKYSIVVSLIISIFLIVYSSKINKEKLKFWNISILILLSFFLAFMLKNITDNFLLYVNTKTDQKDIIVVYKVIENTENKVFELYDNKNLIYFETELNKINQYRIDHKMKSVFEYKNKDTIHVKFNRGLMNINYME